MPSFDTFVVIFLIVLSIIDVIFIYLSYKDKQRHECEQKCKYCNFETRWYGRPFEKELITKNELYTQSVLAMLLNNDIGKSFISVNKTLIEIKHCPMCGRKL